MVKYYYLQLFELLRKALSPTDEAVNINHFEVIWKEAAKQTVDGMLYRIPKLQVKQEERAFFLQWIGNMPRLESSNRWMNEQVVELAKIFDAHSIRYAVMKGQICAIYYPSPLLRMPGDIDVYVAEGDYNKANQLILEHGFRKIDETMLHSTYQRGRLVVELHFAIQKLQWIRSFRKLQELTRKEVDDNPIHSMIEIEGYPVAVLPAELNMILLTAHCFNHIVSGGLGLRQVMDWMLVFEKTRSNMELEKLKCNLESLHLMRMFRVLGYVCVTYLGMKEEKSRIDKDVPAFRKEDAKLGERLLQWVMVSGNFGHSLELGTGGIRFMRYYSLFLYNCVRFLTLNPTEMLSWPWMKLYRGITGKNHRTS